MTKRRQPSMRDCPEAAAVDGVMPLQGWEIPTLPDDAPLIPRPQPWTPVAAVFCVAIFAFLLWRFLENPVVDRAVILEYLFKDVTLRGVGVTLYLTAVSMVAGIAGAILLAIMHLSDNIVLSSLARLYISIFRGTPLLVQLIFWGYLGIFTPDISLSLPGIGTLFSVPTSDVVTPMVAAILALSLNAAAYSAEIVRSGILSVPRGQVEAARSVGMTRFQAFRRVVMPQALRVIIPPMGNEVIAMLKGTSLVTAISNIYDLDSLSVPVERSPEGWTRSVMLHGLTVPLARLLSCARDFELPHPEARAR